MIWYDILLTITLTISLYSTFAYLKEKKRYEMAIELVGMGLDREELLTKTFESALKMDDPKFYMENEYENTIRPKYHKDLPIMTILTDMIKKEKLTWLK